MHCYMFIIFGPCQSVFRDEIHAQNVRMKTGFDRHPPLPVKLHAAEFPWTNVQMNCFKGNGHATQGAVFTTTMSVFVSFGPMTNIQSSLFFRRVQFTETHQWDYQPEQSMEILHWHGLLQLLRAQYDSQKCVREPWMVMYSHFQIEPVTKVSYAFCLGKRQQASWLHVCYFGDFPVCQHPSPPRFSLWQEVDSFARSPQLGREEGCRKFNVSSVTVNIKRDHIFVPGPPSTHRTNQRLPREGWRDCSTIRRWSVTWRAWKWPMLLCLTNRRRVPKPWVSATGAQQFSETHCRKLLQARQVSVVIIFEMLTIHECAISFRHNKRRKFYIDAQSHPQNMAVMKTRAE